MEFPNNKQDRKIYFFHKVDNIYEILLSSVISRMHLMYNSLLIIYYRLNEKYHQLFIFNRISYVYIFADVERNICAHTKFNVEKM